MTQKLFFAAGLVIATLAPEFRVSADTVAIQFGGAGISGTATLTFGPDTVANDPSGAYAITNISGTFSDSNIPISHEAITGLVAIDPAPFQGAPFPASLSFLTVTGLSSGSALSYDDLYYPGGSPITCTDYPGSGGFLDIYGVLFTLANGDTVDLWSNGTFANGPPLSFGAAVVNGSLAVVDYESDGIAASAVPEPGSLCLLATGLLGALTCRLRFAASRSRVVIGFDKTRA